MRVIPSPVSIAVRSYGNDVAGWFRRIGRGYAISVGLIATGAISILVAIGVGIAAVFHILEVRYGASVAYAAIGGVLFLFGLIEMLAGRALMKRPLPRLPSPHRQVAVLKRSITEPVATGLFSSALPGARLRADPVTQTLVAVAAAILIGWIVVSRTARKE